MDYNAACIWSSKPPKQTYLLPNPHNKGEDWYKEAIEAISGLSSRFKSREKWVEFWMRCKVFRDNREEIESRRSVISKEQGQKWKWTKGITREKSDTGSGSGSGKESDVLGEEFYIPWDVLEGTQVGWCFETLRSGVMSGVITFINRDLETQFIYPLDSPLADRDMS